MLYEVEYTDEFESWWDALSARAQDDVSRIVDRLVKHGPQLPYPHGSAVTQSRHGHMRERRIQSGGRPIRVFYAFDPRRTAMGIPVQAVNRVSEERECEGIRLRLAWVKDQPIK